MSFGSQKFTCYHGTPIHLLNQLCLFLSKNIFASYAYTDYPPHPHSCHRLVSYVSNTTQSLLICFGGCLSAIIKKERKKPVFLKYTVISILPFGINYVEITGKNRNIKKKLN